MQKIITTLAIFIAVNKAHTIDCLFDSAHPSSSCYDTILSCPPNENCIINCAGSKSCQYSTMHCPSNAECQVFCTNYASCYETIINATLSTQLLVTPIPSGAATVSILNTNVEFAIGSANILCPFCGDCNAEFVGENCGYDEGTVINATYSSTLNVYVAGGTQVLVESEMHCPRGGSCFLECDGSFWNTSNPNADAPCKFIDVYAQESDYLQIDIVDGADSG
eukprot:979612_1